MRQVRATAAFCLMSGGRRNAAVLGTCGAASSAEHAQAVNVHSSVDHSLVNLDHLHLRGAAESPKRHHERRCTAACAEADDEDGGRRMRARL